MAKKDATQPGASDQKAKADWESIERDYRAGVLSIREIARLHGVSDTAIRNKAKGDPEKGIPAWERDLSAKVQEAVRTELVRTQVRTSNAEDKLRTEKQIIQEAAATVVEVVRSHRKGISAGQKMVGILMSHLHEAATMRGEIMDDIEAECKGDRTADRYNRMMRAISVPAQAGTVRDLANAMKQLVYLERQAFNINGGEDEPAPDNDATPQDKVKDRYARMRAKAAARIAGIHADAAE